MTNATTSGAIHFAHSTSKSESQFGLLDGPFVAGASVVGRLGRGEKEGSTNDAIVDAVFAHIQAMRKLGHSAVNTHQIAKALGLVPRDVEAAVAELTQRGMKIKPR